MPFSAQKSVSSLAARSAQSISIPLAMRMAVCRATNSPYDSPVVLVSGLSCSGRLVPSKRSGLNTPLLAGVASWGAIAGAPEPGSFSTMPAESRFGLFPMTALLSS
ncbi:hypothetical protein D3C87_1624610 [compost metagenome]